MDDLQKRLTDKGLKIALAESCTGGLFAHYFTRTPGSSKYFMGSVVAYEKSVKINILRVPQNVPLISKECAEHMAFGLTHNIEADIYVSTTGRIDYDHDNCVFVSILYDGDYYTTKYTDDEGDRTRTIRTIIDKTAKRIYELI